MSTSTPTKSRQELEQLAVTTIRTLAIDSVDKANSGHPGLPMGAAPMAYVLWSHIMRHNPKDPTWANRDRFVLSAGHGSALLYSLLHLFDYGLTTDDLAQFRQWNSKTPGHPEYRHTKGVEMTTGPLGQGIAGAVGMALAERHLASQFNKPGYPVIDHHTYALVGDGDLMEGISYEATSFAGHQQLDRLIVLYDSNSISLDGPTSNAFTENVAARFEALNWRVLRVEDGNDLAAIEAALKTAREGKGQPTLIEVRTVIGFGSPNRQGTSKAHGNPLGEAEAKLAKKAYGWPEDAPLFYVPDEVPPLFAEYVKAGQALQKEWDTLLAGYTKEYPELAKTLHSALSGALPEAFASTVPFYETGSAAQATRQSSGAAMNAIAANTPLLIGGSADLSGSNETTITGESILTYPEYSGRNIWFGVREHAMGAMLNGITLHGGLRVFGGTFMVFSDYLRPSIRLAALMKLPVIYVFTHDSIGVGEDGPTHQPVEQLAALRVIPGLVTLRPADANETSAAWIYAVGQSENPVALALTRQKLPILPGSKDLAMGGVKKGGYVLSPEAGDQIDVMLIASGSEVSLAMAAKDQLTAKGLAVRVVSMPSFALFEAQTDAYKESVLPSHVHARVGIEMAHPFGWDRYTGDAGQIVAINHFGASAPAETLFKEFGFTAEAVVAAAQKSIERAKKLFGGK